MSLCNNSSDNKSYWVHRVDVKSVCTSRHCHIYAPITAFVTFTPINFTVYVTLTWQSLDLVQCHLQPPVQAVPPYRLPHFSPSWTEEQVKAGICAHDRRAVQQLALNVHIKHWLDLNQLKTCSITFQLFKIIIIIIVLFNDATTHF